LDIPTKIMEPEGLSSREAEARLAAHGPNAVAEEPHSLWRSLFAKFWAPVPWLLEAAMMLQVALGEYVEAGVIGTLLALNVGLAIIQESRASAALAALKQRLAPAALVRRDGSWTKRPAADLVPGDVIRLPLGAVVPADARIASGAVLVDQSMLTGESVPVDAAAGETLYAGALIRRGEAIAEVTATGARTYFGRTAELVRVAHPASTEQAAIMGTVQNLAALNGAVALIVVLYAHFVAGLHALDVTFLGLTALLAAIPVALPATFALSAALGAQTLARQGVLLTRLSAAHETAGMDVLCADKTGTLTRNAMEVAEVVPMPGFDRARVLALAAFASSLSDLDPIDATLQKAALAATSAESTERLLQFTPFDPATRMSEALIASADGATLRVAKGAVRALAPFAQVSDEAHRLADALAAQGHRVIAVAAGAAGAAGTANTTKPLVLAGLVALSDPPREDSAELVAALRALGVKTIMVTGDSPVTAAAIARKVGIPDRVSPAERLDDARRGEEFDVLARVVPEEKFNLVKVLQERGHTVGMCGDGANDAPALRQAQIGIAVSTATDVAKAAAAMVLTEPGLSGIVHAVREGRVAFQRLKTYTLNMLTKKIELVLLLAVGLFMTGGAVVTPTLMVLLLATNDFLTMSLTTDRASASPEPGRWRMGRLMAMAGVAGLLKLCFSVGAIALGELKFGFSAAELQTFTFVTLVFGNQAVLFVLRERGHLWRSMPSPWLIASAVVDVTVVAGLALSGVLMAKLPWPFFAGMAGAALVFALVLDQIKVPLLRALRIA